MDKNLSIINNFKKKDYNSYPFPYFVIDKPYNDKIYSNLEKDYNLFISHFKKNEDYEKNNIRLQISSNDFFKSNLFKNSIWHDFISYHSSKKFFLDIIDIFYDDIYKIYPDIINLIENNKNKENFLGLREKKNNEKFFFVSDCQPGINTPVKIESTVRNSHVDNPVELIAGLFYLRLPNDNSIGGDLEIMENNNKNEIKFYNKAEVYNNNDLKVFKKINYKKNNVIFFLNTINSIHRISPREKCSIPRNLTNIIFETYYIKEKLFKINYKKNFFSLIKNKLGL
jgi:hypothetical protein